MQVFQWRLSGAILLFATMLLCGHPLFSQQASGTSSSQPSQASALFESNCAACHGSDGRGGERAPDIARTSEVQQLSNKDLMGIVSNGISGTGMPAFSSLGQEQIKSIVKYLRVLQGSGSISKLPGDPKTGEALFFGKARCSSCHLVNGKGGFIANDLTFYGADKTADQIRNIITNPDKYLSRQSRPVTVIESDGKKLTGMVRSNDNFTIVLQGFDGSFHFFNKSHLKEVEIGPHSLMPGNYASTLSDKEVDDLVSYLINVAREEIAHAPKQQSGNHASEGDDN